MSVVKTLRLKRVKTNALLLYFSLGCIIDLLITLYGRAVALRLKMPGAVLTTIITCATFVVFNNVIKKWNWALVIFYALGTGIGAYIGMILL